MKTNILDTNVILDHPITHIIESFIGEDTEIKVVVPFKVLIELDTFKKGNDPINEHARMAIRFLDNLRAHGNLSEGVIYNDRFIIQVCVPKEDLVFDPDNKVDHNILMTACRLKESGSQVEIVTRDLHERILADVLGIMARDINIDKAASDELYEGIERIEITDEQLQQWFSNPKGYSLPAPIELYSNEFVEMTDPMGAKHYGVYDYKTGDIVELRKSYTAWGIKPKRNNEGNMVVEQAMFMHLLLDPSVEFVSAIGSAGTGKTLLALACGLEQTLGKFPSLYDRIVILRPMVGADKDIGALPGTKNEKLEPWMAPIFDNLEFLLDNYTPKDLAHRKDNMYMPISPRDRVFELIDTGKLELEAITFIRGRSMPRQFIIVDDAQNLTPQQAATIITRAGDGTKVVFLGDVSRQQIDDRRLTPRSNGLAYTVDRLKGKDPIIGHITMKEVVRSRLAMLGVEYL